MQCNRVLIEGNEHSLRLLRSFSRFTSPQSSLPSIQQPEVCLIVSELNPAHNITPYIFRSFLVLSSDLPAGHKC